MTRVTEKDGGTGSRWKVISDDLNEPQRREDEADSPHISETVEHEQACEEALRQPLSLDLASVRADRARTFTAARFQCDLTVTLCSLATVPSQAVTTELRCDCD